LADPQTLPVTESQVPKFPRGPKGIPLDYLISLRNKKLTHDQIANIVGTSRSNISQRLKEVEDQISWTTEFRANRAFLLSNLQHRIINSITPADIQKANLRDKIISAGILFDKERLEMGLSTSNIAYADMIEGRKSAIKELDELDKRYAPKVDQ